MIMSKRVQKLSFSAAVVSLGCALACLPTQGAAQIPLPQRVLGLTASTSDRGGITVGGRAELRVVPDKAYFTVTIGYAQGRGTSNPATVAETIAKALTSAGARGISTTPTGNGNQLFLGQGGTYTIRGSLDRPTPERAAGLITAGDAAAAPYNDMRVQQLVVSPAFTDCGALDARLQTAALADARAHAERLAKAAGVKLGHVTAIVEASRSRRRFRSSGKSR